MAKVPEWMNDPLVEEWISKFAYSKGYRRNFIKWVKWLGMPPREQLEKRKEDLKSDDLKVKRFFEEKLKEWGREIMKEGLSVKTGQQYLIPVRSFFSHHYLDLKFRRGELKLEELPEVKASKKPKWVIDNVEFRAIFSVCNPRDRPLLLILGSTGLSPVDVAQLRIEGLRLYENGKLTEKPVYGIKAREKSAVNQHFILGEEVLFYLDPILKERGYPSSGYLLVTRKGNPYTQRTINDRIKSLVEKALGIEKLREWETKNLRDFFRNCLLLAEINVEVQDAMMGWQRGGASPHYQISEVVIQSAYEKAKEHFSVDGERQRGEKLAKIEKEVGKLALGFQYQIDELKQEVQKLQEVIGFSLDEWKYRSELYDRIQRGEISLDEADKLFKKRFP